MQICLKGNKKSYKLSIGVKFKPKTFFKAARNVLHKQFRESNKIKITFV